MSLTQHDVESTYQAILDRAPSRDEAARIAQQHSSLKALRQAILNSEEFYVRFQAMRANFEARQRAILVHPLIPGAAGDALLDALAAAPELQPQQEPDEKGIASIRALPRPERLKLRLVQGDLDGTAGSALDLPFRTLCILRRPGPRLYRLWRLLCPADSADSMDFGEMLEYSLNSPPHRMEMDNGQIRRLAGDRSETGIGHEPALLRRALLCALSPGTVLGLAEKPMQVLEALADQNLISLPEAALTDDPDDTEALKKAVEGLSDAQRRIFDAYTAWDDYLYEVCKALLDPPVIEEGKSS